MARTKANTFKNPNRHVTEEHRCKASFGGQQCVLLRGIDNHRTRRSHGNLLLPVLIHQDANGREWT